MFKKSLKNTIGINVGAFILVAILQITSVWTIKDKFETDYSFYLWRLNYTTIIMLLIWINHFVLIPVFYDKQRYWAYGLLLICTIFIGSFFRGYANGWQSVSKFFFFLLYTTGSGMGIYFIARNIMIQRENDEKEKLKSGMELKYLKAQVNPHFLFNTLNSIYALSRVQSPETPDVVMQLSELMRYQLESSKKDAVLVKDELAFIANYLLLEEKRLSERCNIELTIEGALDKLTIAPMLLIPFIENAIKHGAQSTNNNSKVDIFASVKKARLHFKVFNTKPGMEATAHGNGIGLENVKRRLDLLYPKAHNLEIENKADSYRVNLCINLSASPSTALV